MRSGQSERAGHVYNVPHPGAEKPDGVDHIEWLDSGGATLGWYVNAGKRAGMPAVSTDSRVQAAYVALRMDGRGHTLADMFAHRTPPMSNSDREFLEGRGGCYDQFGDTPLVGDTYRAMAKRAGVDITGQVYVSGLASFPGDPTAWVGGRGDVERVAREKGMSVDGSVTVRPDGRWEEPPPDVGVADDLVQSRVADRTAADPSLALRDAGEVFHETREMIRPHWA